MIVSLLYGLIGLFGLYQLFQTKNTFQKVVFGLFVAAAILLLMPYDLSKFGGFLLSFLGIILITSYGLFKKGLKTKKRVSVLVISFPLLIEQLFAINRYPYFYIITYTMLIPIMMYLYIVLTKFKEYRKEFGFISILFIFALIRLLSLFM